MTVNQPLQSAIVVIFGGEGDLTWRKLIRALFTLPHIRYLRGDCGTEPFYLKLGQRCAALEQEWSSKTLWIYYMAPPSSLFGEIPTSGSSRICCSCGRIKWRSRGGF
jgi:hypothetical protein